MSIVLRLRNRVCYLSFLRLSCRLCLRNTKSWGARDSVVHCMRHCLWEKNCVDSHSFFFFQSKITLNKGTKSMSSCWLGVPLGFCALGMVWASAARAMFSEQIKPPKEFGTWALWTVCPRLKGKGLCLGLMMLNFQPSLAMFAGQKAKPAVFGQHFTQTDNTDCYLLELEAF